MQTHSIDDARARRATCRRSSAGRARRSITAATSTRSAASSSSCCADDAVRAAKAGELIAKHQLAPPPPPRELRTEVPAHLDVLVATCSRRRRPIAESMSAIARGAGRRDDGRQRWARRLAPPPTTVASPRAGRSHSGGTMTGARDAARTRGQRRSAVAAGGAAGHAARLPYRRLLARARSTDARDRSAGRAACRGDRARSPRPPPASRSRVRRTTKTRRAATRRPRQRDQRWCAPTSSALGAGRRAGRAELTTMRRDYERERTRLLR